jgi:membrane-bound lytic murein transglycosylase
MHATFRGTTVVTDAQDLARVARDTLAYIDFCQAKRPDIIDPQGMCQIITAQQVKRTLNFIVKVAEHDQTRGTHLLSDQRFLTQNFDVISWKADRACALKHNLELPESGAIRVTNYAIFCVPGSELKTKEFSCALYYLKNDAVRTTYTKQEIIAGVFEKSKYKTSVQPLVWLTRSGLEDALMQGTVMVQLPGGEYRFFNVHKNNGIPYDKNLTDMRKQKRYWFFKEVSDSHGDTMAMKQKLESRQHVVFAGDVYNIGIGKVIAILYRNALTQEPEIRLGILADMGGAFINNLYQLDLFSGIFTSRSEWREKTAQLPCYAHAYILCKK